MRWVESGDVRLAVFEEGDPANPTVLLLHGYPDTHRVWNEVATLLRDRYHVVRYDVRGAGESTAPRDRRDYGFDHLVADLGAVIDAQGASRVHLVGHDWGSLQGWEALGRAGLRERIASFTSLGGPGLRQTAHFLRHGRRRDVAVQRIKSWYIGAFQVPVVPELAWGSVMPGVISRTLRREGISPRPGHPAPTLARDGRNGLWMYRRNMGTDGDPGVGDVPVQIIEATRDAFVTPALLASIGQWVPRLRHRKVAAGHWAHRSRPEVVARLIAEFAQSAEPAPAAPTTSATFAASNAPAAASAASAASNAPAAPESAAGSAVSATSAAPAVRWERRAFEGQLVVVTGAGSGIGLATARAFAAHGAEVVCADIDADAAGRAADAIAKDLGGTGHAAQVDVSNIDQMEDFSRNIIAQYGVPDIVVNNAGIVIAGSFLDHTVDDWRRTIDVNLWGVIHGCRLFCAAMVERGEGGHIVNVASLAAFAPSRLLPAYSASKAAVKMLSDCLRAELAGHGIGVSAVCPGFVSTPIARNATYVGADLREEAVRGLARRGYPAERVAAHILRAVHRNQAVVPVNLEGKIGYALSRISPGTMRALARWSGTIRNPGIGR
ncbi:SDR family oxidoreductase [Nonomuraea angiospora]|uniref:NAD(P)-dependent dehydrogenase (Short-subunit alcohol dehydrogenase family)/pimeloyl-ACP methyl ester carboxylesterase n=1 Tax=Nonomuraea angiospora TaxID=46172 RepID=A0ABR9M926_9ACTN|nr:SDR family oxidoreductase [Nonomuraea angiospora]MBE1589400.1 NAD(P)-dependent dehydrogenase (short-subunit alcohol dehydrogenase family)/pimeloyl-ACP methyl ester carboxylesterase [Nonomuraea angiospora]